MKSYRILLFDSCDLCAGDLEYESSAEEGFFNDGDSIRCKTCKASGTMKIDKKSTSGYTVDWNEEEIDAEFLEKALKSNCVEVCYVKWCRSGLKPEVYIYQLVYGKSCKVGICKTCNESLKLKEGDSAPDYDDIKKLLKIH